MSNQCIRSAARLDLERCHNATSASAARFPWQWALLLIALTGIAAPHARADGPQPDAAFGNTAPDKMAKDPARQAPAIAATYLRVEHLVDPLGVDVQRPHLSWQIQSKERGVMQAAYQVLVATSTEQLARNQGDLWDSGKVDGDRSLEVRYGGKPLGSYQRCYWKVRVWTQRGEVSAWSRAARWTMGILDPAQWRAKWLSYIEPLGRKVDATGPEKLLNFDGVEWIWTNSNPNAAHVHFFRRRVDLPQDGFVKWAYLTIAATEPYRLWANGQQVSKSAATDRPWRRAYEVEMTSRLRPGHNELAIDIPRQTPGLAGVALKLVVVMSTGKQVVLVTDATWKADTRGGRDWFGTEFDDSHWQGARVVASVGQGRWGVPRPGPRVGWSQRASSPMFRKSFRVAKPIHSATVSVCGLGYHQLYINGRRVGDHVLDPAFTRYDRRVLYVTHDVTELLRSGANAIGVMLGNGWYNMHTRATWDFDLAPWRAPPTLLLQLRIELADGSVQTVVSGASWRASTGPVILDSIRAGEWHDARREQPGWSKPGFDDSRWHAPTIVAGPKGRLAAQLMPAIKVTQTIKPVKITQPRPGVFVFDMGQNIAGWARLRVHGPAGTKVTLRYSERIDSSGMIERREIEKYVFEGPFQTDTYILRGADVEQWEPCFAYHGFRYIEVTGLPGKPDDDTITGCVVHTAFRKTGEFRCSNELLNAIQRLTCWSYRNNFHGYPTDCPTREKNGWTGDAHLAAEQAMYNFDNVAAYHKWIQDIHDEQRDSGEIAAIIPTGGWGYAWGNGPAWDSAFILIPWYLYVYQGDTDILARHYDRMRRYVDYLTRRSKNHIVSIGLGDWVPAKTVTPAVITSTAYYYVDTRIVARVAKLLGKDDDAAKYQQLADATRDAFNREFYRGRGVYLNGSQTSLSCAIYQGLVEPREMPAVLARLVADVHANQNHLDVGILGAKYLFHSLSDHGRHALAYQIATRATPPSYGDWVKRGATTLWESWDGLSSLDHIMFGDISAWFYQELAGLHADANRPGFKHIIIRPRPVEGLTWAAARVESPYGTIRSKWRRDGANWLLEVSIPANTRATVYLLGRDPNAIQESRKPIADVAAVRLLGVDGDRVKLSVGSGTYRFLVRGALGAGKP